jgi:hypothetical protein
MTAQQHLAAALAIAKKLGPYGPPELVRIWAYHMRAALGRVCA